MKKQLVISLLALFLSGCESPALLVKKDDAAYAPPEDIVVPETQVRGGGLYNGNYNWSLTQDRRAYRVGDILTVKLDESTQASKQARTNFGKNRKHSAIQSISFPARLTATETLTVMPPRSSKTVCAARSPLRFIKCCQTACWRFAGRNGSPSTRGMSICG